MQAISHARHSLCARATEGLPHERAYPLRGLRKTQKVDETEEELQQRGEFEAAYHVEARESTQGALVAHNIVK